MIIGIGVDLVDSRRIESLLKRFGQRFTKKVFTINERAYADSNACPFRAYANRFAAKEAAVKALGTGFQDGIGWQDVEVSRTSFGAPSLILHRKAYKKLLSLAPVGYRTVSHISFSDETPHSIAFVVLSAISNESVV